MADVVFGGIFLILVWYCYKTLSSVLAKAPSYDEIMRACFRAIACSVALTLYAVFVVAYGNADASPFAATLALYWLYALLVGGLLGGVGIVCATVALAVRKFSRQAERIEKGARENDHK